SVVWSPSALVSLSSATSTSNASGNVSAIATLGSTAGAAQVQLRTVGTGQTPFDPRQNIIQTLFNLTVTAGSAGPPAPGQPATLRILSGNNQSGPPGARLPSPLTARVEDATGNPLPNVPVIWDTPSAVTLSGVSSASDGSGIVSATATLGSVVGVVQVTLRTTGGIQTPFGVTPGVALAIPF